MSESQKFQDNEAIIVTKGSKSLPKDTEVTVLGHDAVNDTYAVKLPDGTIRTARASVLGRKPERTFTQSEIEQGLTDLGLDGPAIVHDLLYK